MRKFLGILIITLSAIFLATPTLAADIDDARSVAVSILNSFESKKASVVWDQQVSSWFKDKMTRDAFLANSTFMQTQLGGVSSARKLVQQNRSDGDPKVNYKGDVFSFTFSTTYPTSNVYENIVLIREGGTYKMSGLYFVPNPN